MLWLQSLKDHKRQKIYTKKYIYICIYENTEQSCAFPKSETGYHLLHTL